MRTDAVRQLKQRKSPAASSRQASCTPIFQAIKKAANQNRTGDLHITNVTLYRLSHSSLLTSLVNEKDSNTGRDACQSVFYKLPALRGILFRVPV